MELYHAVNALKGVEKSYTIPLQEINRVAQESGRGFTDTMDAIRGKLGQSKDILCDSCGVLIDFCRCTEEERGEDDEL